VVVSPDGGFNVPACGVCMTPDSGIINGCGTGPACPSSLRCVFDGASSTYQCVAPQPEGAPCTSTRGCADDLVCKSAAADGGTRFCARRSGAGAACQSSSECDPVLGLRCITGVCAAPTFVGLGAACDASSRFCDGGNHCHYATNGTTGVCEAPAADGTACGQGGPTCSDPASCRDGICRLPGEANCH
jgi:hypothetical protein